MPSRLLLVELLLGTALPLALLAKKRLDVRRDFFMLVVYLQALLYVFVGPLVRLRRMTSPPIKAYETLATAAFFLVLVVFLVVYLWLVRRTPVRPPDADRRLAGNSIRLDLILYGLLAFSITFWAIAWSSDLIYRRIGNPLVAFQLRLPFIEFVIYRTYIESLFFIVALVMLALVVEGRQLSGFAWAAALLVLLSAYAYLVINSRIGLALTLTMALGVWTFFWKGARGFLPRFALGSSVCIVLLLYSHATTQRIRLGYSKTGSVTWRGFVPGIPLEPATPVVARPGWAMPASVLAKAAGTSPEMEEVAQDLPDLVNKALFYKTSVEMPLSVRLDGLDLMVQMRPALETLGYAWGRAWKVPVALVYLPVLHPQKAREYKMSLDMAAKNYLMRRYTKIPDADYVSCMLTDAYGNFGYLGLALVGLFLAGVTGGAAWMMRRPHGGGWVLVGLFALSHLIIFEQEFVSALLLWTKKLPFLIALLVAAPFRVVVPGTGVR